MNLAQTELGSQQAGESQGLGPGWEVTMLSPPSADPPWSWGPQPTHGSSEGIANLQGGMSDVSCPQQGQAVHQPSHSHPQPRTSLSLADPLTRQASSGIRALPCLQLSAKSLVFVLFLLYLW